MERQLRVDTWRDDDEEGMLSQMSSINTQEGDVFMKDTCASILFSCMCALVCLLVQICMHIRSHMHAHI